MSEDSFIPQKDPEFWQLRAKEARFQADQISDPEFKRGMLSIADTYDRMAMRAEVGVSAKLARPHSTKLSRILRDVG